MIEDALKIFGDEIVKEIKNDLIKNNKDDGELYKTLSTKVIEKDGDYILYIYAEDYYKFVDNGRRPGTYPPLREITKWAKMKGINKKYVFPIMKKIKDKGIKGIDITKSVMKNVIDGKSFDELEKNVRDNLIDEIKNNLNYE